MLVMTNRCFLFLASCCILLHYKINSTNILGNTSADKLIYTTEFQLLNTQKNLYVICKDHRERQLVEDKCIQDVMLVQEPWYGLDSPIPGRVEIFLFSVESKIISISIHLFPALKYVQPPIQWVARAVSRGVK